MRYLCVGGDGEGKTEELVQRAARRLKRGERVLMVSLNERMARDLFTRTMKAVDTLPGEAFDKHHAFIEPDGAELMATSVEKTDRFQGMQFDFVALDNAGRIQHPKAIADVSFATHPDGDVAFAAGEGEGFEVRLGLELLERKVHGTATRKGWHDEPRSVPELIALMHSELSEALEGYREGDPPSDKIDGFTSVEEELADTVIRVFDTAAENDLKVKEALRAKMAYNEGREHRHGGKRL